MIFAAARPDVVRAINQRWLLKFWKQHLGIGWVPPWQAVDSESLARIVDSLSFLDVIGAGEQARFQVTFHGSMIARVYGSPDCRGRFVDEIIPVRNHPTGLAPYGHVLKTGCPIYTIHDVTDRNNRVIHFERLLLPFSSDGTNLDRILASIEFICADGAFESYDLLKIQTLPPLRLSAMIERQALT